MHIEPVTLTGKVVRLEPLQMHHAAELFEVSQDSDIWKYMPTKPPRLLADMEEKLEVALQEQKAGTRLPFAIIHLPQETVVGATSYLNIAQQDRGLEIGWTWLTPSVQRTGVNTECKYLLLRHAFEVLGTIRVQLKTHHLNLKSQQAIERLGAVKEGVLRNHIIMPDGSYRHSVYYSILDNEWPEIKKGLEANLTSSPQYPRKMPGND